MTALMLKKSRRFMLNGYLRYARPTNILINKTVVMRRKGMAKKR